MILFDYFRSSASYRVRIALNLKNIKYEKVSINLVEGMQQSSDYLENNPQGLVPLLDDNGFMISQSLAICEYLEEAYPDSSILPADPKLRALSRGYAQIIACDIHPLNNLRVLSYLENELSIPQKEKMDWYKHWLIKGLESLESKLKKEGLSGEFCIADQPTLADICLIPQLYNAHRFNIDTRHLTEISRIETNCHKQKAFIEAHPART